MPRSRNPKDRLQHAEELHRDYVVQFLAEIMQVTGLPSDQETFQHALQTYVDGLLPWLDPKDGPPAPRGQFTLIEKFEFEDAGENVAVVLSPEAEALFCAWLRRNKIASDAGLNTAHAWSN
jgi:hypothetical protein